MISRWITFFRVLTPRTRKPAHGEGAILQRKDGRWQGALTLGFGDRGTQKRKTVYGKTQAEVLAKLAAVKRQHAAGTHVTTSQTLGGYLESWLRHKALEVKPRTVAFYQSYAERQVLPAVGVSPSASTTCATCTCRS